MVSKKKRTVNGQEAVDWLVTGTPAVKIVTVLLTIYTTRYLLGMPRSIEWHFI